MKKSKKISLIGYGITTCIFLAVTLWIMGVFGSYSGAGMAVWLLGVYFITPVTSLIVGVYFGLKCAFLKWFYPIVFGFWGFIIPCLATGNFIYETISLFFSLIPALFGVAVGTITQKIREGKGRENL